MALERWRSRGALTREPRTLAQPMREFEDLLDRFFGDSPWGSRIGQARGWAPALDMVDLKNEVLIRADLPGLDQKDIEVSVESGILTIRGERKAEEETTDSDFYCCERWSGSFARGIALPPNVDAGKVRATFKNGVLEIHLPKTQEAMGRKIEVQTA